MITMKGIQTKHEIHFRASSHIGSNMAIGIIFVRQEKSLLCNILSISTTTPTAAVVALPCLISLQCG